MDQALELARSQPEKVVLLYEDEASLYRQPSQASLFAPRGRLQPRLSYACSSNTVMRLVGFLNAVSGAINCYDASKITADRLAKFLKQIDEIYSHAEQIYIVLDNWPVHFHPRIQRVLEQRPRIHLLPLPTYAPWLNKIEKVWRKLKQEVVHAHELSHDFNQFKQTVRTCIANQQSEPQALLRYVGLIQ